jgi:hypothetical protein
MYLRNDKAFDRQVDEFLLSAKEKDQIWCYGPEVGVMLKKLEERIKVARPMCEHILNLFRESNRTA